MKYLCVIAIRRQRERRGTAEYKGILFQVTLKWPFSAATIFLLLRISVYIGHLHSQTVLLVNCIYNSLFFTNFFFNIFFEMVIIQKTPAKNSGKASTYRFDPYLEEYLIHSYFSTCVSLSVFEGISLFSHQPLIKCMKHRQFMLLLTYILHIFPTLICNCILRLLTNCMYWFTVTRMCPSTTTGPKKLKNYTFKMSKIGISTHNYRNLSKQTQPRSKIA